MSIHPYRGQVPLNGPPDGTVSSSVPGLGTSSVKAPAPNVWRDERGRFMSRPFGPYEPVQRPRQAAPKKQDPLSMLQEGMRLIEASMAATIALVGELQKDCGYMATENVRSQRVIRDSLSKLANQRNRGNRAPAETNHTGGQSFNAGRWANQGFLSVNQEQRGWYVARPSTTAASTTSSASNLDVELSVSVQDRRSPIIDPGCPEDIQARSSEVAEVPRGRRTPDDLAQSPL